jgi:hypothetical protein
MQPCNRIYYSKIYWRLNMLQAAYRSSSRAPNCISSLWFIYPCGYRPLSRLGGNSPPSLDNRRSPHRYITKGWKYSLELLMMIGMPSETCWNFNKFWNNKFYYNVAFCWLFVLIHTTMHGSMNIKFKRTRQFRRKTKSVFCACAITFQTQSSNSVRQMFLRIRR